MNKTGVIYGINGPVVYLKGNTGFKMSEMVYVGKERLVGEVIALTKDTTTVQVFEETTGLRPGDPVEATGDAISVLLGPGIIHNIFDGIQRPLEEIAKASGKYRRFSGYREKMGCPCNCFRRRRADGRRNHCRNTGNPFHRSQIDGSAGCQRHGYLGCQRRKVYHP